MAGEIKKEGKGSWDKGGGGRKRRGRDAYILKI